MRVGLAAVPLNFTTPVTEAPPGKGAGLVRPAAQSMVRETRSREKMIRECLFMYPPAKYEFANCSACSNRGFTRLQTKGSSRKSLVGNYWPLSSDFTRWKKPR